MHGTKSYSEESFFCYHRSWTGFGDELAWGAAWLYKATGQAKYLEAAESLYGSCCSNTAGAAYNWDGKGELEREILWIIHTKCLERT